MVKLSHKKVRKEIAERNWKQEPIAEVLQISDRHVRNICSKDTDAAVSLCYRLSRVFGTTIEDLLIIREAEE